MKTYHQMTQDLLADEDLDEEIQQLDEIALRTVAIGGFLMKTKGYARKIDSEVRRLVADADKLKRTEIHQRKPTSPLLMHLRQLHHYISCSGRC